MTVTPEIEAALDRYVAAVTEWHGAADALDDDLVSPEEREALKVMVEARRALHIALGIGRVLDLPEPGSWT